MNELEMNGRFAAVEAQRNNALNQNVLDAGVIAVLRAQIADLQKQLAAAKAATETPVVAEA